MSATGEGGEAVTNYEVKSMESCYKAIQLWSWGKASTTLSPTPLLTPMNNGSNNDDDDSSSNKNNIHNYNSGI